MLNDNNKEVLSVVKIGGNVVDNKDSLDIFLSDFAQLKGRKVLVHGGGVMASKMSKQMGIETKMVDGRRITDEETLRIVTMVYAGWINKNIVAGLQKVGCNAIGLSGADANVIPSLRRSATPIDYGFVGDPLVDKVNSWFISKLVESGITPVFCAITHDGKGSLLNTNADTIAYSVATSLTSYYKTSLLYCFEKEGVLMDIEKPDSIIERIDKNMFENLKAEGIIADGMIPKLDNAYMAIDNGVSEVKILHAKNLLTNKGTILL